MDEEAQRKDAKAQGRKAIPFGSPTDAPAKRGAHACCVVSILAPLRPCVMPFSIGQTVARNFPFIN
jgi:hypothetical protein